MNTHFNRRRARMRGVTLVEALVSASLSAGIFGTAIGVYVRGTHGFQQEQSQAYVQSRARVALDSMAKDVRAAKAFASTLTANGVSYTASDGSAGAGCLILQVPAQKKQDMSLIYQSGAQGTALVLDKVVYYYNAADKTLRFTVEPSDAGSFRTTATGAILAANVTGFAYVKRDRDGVPTASAGRVAAMDLTATLSQASIGVPAGAVAVSGVRLRNMRSGTIRGAVQKNGAPVAGATVQAVFSADSGAYTSGTTVGSPATTAADGSFEIFGLDPGTYSLQITSVGITSRGGFTVPDEDTCDAGTITLS